MPATPGDLQAMAMAERDDAPRTGARAGHPLADDEIRYLGWFGAGPIDEPETQVRLWESWGMCRRHALGFLAVESSLGDAGVFRPVVVYDNVIDRAAIALAPRRLLERPRIAAALRTAEPCPICDPGRSGRRQAVLTAPNIVERGRSLEPLRLLADQTSEHWQAWVCGPCAGTASPARCRLHLAEDLLRGNGVDLWYQRELVDELSRRLRAYTRSFGWANRGTETPADRAGLFGAIGWCGGWRSILEVLG